MPKAAYIRPSYTLMTGAAVPRMAMAKDIQMLVLSVSLMFEAMPAYFQSHSHTSQHPMTARRA